MKDLLQLDGKRFDYKHYLGPAKDMTLRLDFSPKNQKKGGFKIALFGTASQHIFGDTFNICAKQTYYQKRATIDQLGQTIEVTHNIPHDGVTQIRNLSMEIACLVWARVLLDLVYKFIEKGIALRGEPPFYIPQLQFVDAALAVEHNMAKSTDGHVFLLEELIGEGEGRFKKYVNNVSAVPVPFGNGDDQETALFLTFAQHVQYYKTKKLAFVSDYQGEKD
jgi:alpha-kinase family protein